MTAATQESQFHSKDHRGLPMPKNGTYLRPAAVKDLTGEVEHIDKMLSDREFSGKDAALMRKRVTALKSKIAVQGAPELNPEQRDIAARREKELEADIRSSMCSPAEMGRCPTGAVGKFNRGENSPAIKSKTLEWKNIKLMLNPGNTDPDLCNIEQFRKDVVSTLTMANEMIARPEFSFSPNTEEYKRKFDETFGTGPAVEEDPRVAELKLEVEALKQMFLDSQKGAKSKPSKRKAHGVTKKMVCGKVVGVAGEWGHRNSCEDGCTKLAKKE